MFESVGAWDAFVAHRLRFPVFLRFIVFPIDVTLTPVAASESDALRHLAATIWRRHYSTIVPAAQIEYMLERRLADGTLAEFMRAGDRWLRGLRVSGVLVGYCSYELGESHGDDRSAAMKLGQLYVLESHRGLGLGKFMLGHVESEARAAGRHLVFLQVNKRNTAAIGFYESAGYDIAHEAVFDIGAGFVMDDYVMEKRMERASE